jgi:hypothetical protein
MAPPTNVDELSTEVVLHAAERNITKTPTLQTPSEETSHSGSFEQRTTPEKEIAVSGGCVSHASCSPFSKEEFRDLLERVFNSARDGYLIIGNVESSQYAEGLAIMQNLKSGDSWEEDECRYCKIKEFITSMASMPWMLGLKMLGETSYYGRSLRCLEDEEDMKIMDDWVARVVNGKIEV